MDVETFLRESDPARHVEVPYVDSVVAERIHDDVMARLDDRGNPQVRLWKRRVLRVPLAAGLAVGAAIVLVVALVPGTESPQSAAAAALTHLASQATQEPITLGPSQYLYTEVERPTNVVTTGRASGASYSWYLSGSVQTWVAADGSGRQVTTTDPTPRFFSSADRTLWVAAGQPPLAIPPGQLSRTENFGPGSTSEVNTPVPLYDVSNLPTDSGALAMVLGNENQGSEDLGTLPAGISTLDSVSACDSSSCSLFERAAALLQGPDVGETPALRAALFQVLASVPGIQLLGTTVDPTGQSGLGLQLVDHVPASTETVICEPGNAPATSVTETHPASAATFTIVVDPQTTTVLSSGETFTPSLTAALPNPCGSSGGSSQARRLTPSWSTVLAQGIVDSETAIPRAGSL
jgi:hypothetical protein